MCYFGMWSIEKVFFFGVKCCLHLLRNDNYFICNSYQLIACETQNSFIVQHVISEPFEPSPFMPSVNQAFEEDFNVPTNRQQRQEQDAEPSSSFPRSEKESSGRENSVAKIKVVV